MTVHHDTYFVVMHNEFIIYTAFFLIPYFIGSIPFGLVLTKLFLKRDVRSIGSGNIGATNVLRMGNKTLALITFLLDSFKGSILPIFAILMIFHHCSFVDSEGCFAGIFGNLIPLMLFISFFAILGHCFPIWLKFKGGKGVATALGGLLAAVPFAGLAAIIAWLITAKVTKISSLSALIALGVAPIVTLFVYGFAPAGVCTLITLLVWVRHKDNIKRLMIGEEPKIGAKKQETSVESVSK